MQNDLANIWNFPLGFKRHEQMDICCGQGHGGRMFCYPKLTAGNRLPGTDRLWDKWMHSSFALFRVCFYASNVFSENESHQVNQGCNITVNLVAFVLMNEKVLSTPI